MNMAKRPVQKIDFSPYGAAIKAARISHSGQLPGWCPRPDRSSFFQLHLNSFIRLLPENGQQKSRRGFMPAACAMPRLCGAKDNRKGIPFVKIVSLLCKLIQFLMVALSVTVHKALILLVFLNHPYQSLAFSRFCGFYFLAFYKNQIIICNFYASNVIVAKKTCLYYLKPSSF